MAQLLCRQEHLQADICADEDEEASRQLPSLFTAALPHTDKHLQTIICINTILAEIH